MLYSCVNPNLITFRILVRLEYKYNMQKYSCIIYYSSITFLRQGDEQKRNLMIKADILSLFEML